MALSSLPQDWDNIKTCPKIPEIRTEVVGGRIIRTLPDGTQLEVLTTTYGYNSRVYSYRLLAGKCPPNEHLVIISGGDRYCGFGSAAFDPDTGLIRVSVKGCD